MKIKTKKTGPTQKKLNPVQNNPTPKLTEQISLCLVMIVKDEEDTIEKCLKKVSPFISYYVICDTGSSDKTIEVINQTMENLGIPGEVHERPWVNFEVNRTESLELSKGKCDYRWIIDADDTFENLNLEKNPFLNLPKNVDCFQILYRLNTLQYHRAQIVKSDQDWIYKGVLHEYLDLPGANEIKQYQIPGDLCYVKADISPLKRASTLEEKYSNDAKILEEALIKEPDNARYMFYLAQSYRDSGQNLEALKAYEMRVKAGGWPEEVYYSLYMIARIKEKIGREHDEIVTAYSKAWEFRPERLEAVFHLMRKLREKNRWVLSFTYGTMALKNPGTSDILFIEPEIWQWRLLDEYSITSFHTGNPEISFEKMSKVMEMPFFKDLHPTEKDRIINNVQHYKKASEEKLKAISQSKK